MNPPANAVPEPSADPQGIAPRNPAIRPFYWSVRRELWENRSIYLAPIAVAAIALLGYMISTIGQAERRRAALLLAPAAQQAVLQKPYDIVAMVLIFNGLLVGLFYCLDALHGERRDRSLLFWKSLPVSDRTAVLSKATIPLVVLPALSFLLVVTTQLLMLLWSTLVLLLHGLGAASWTRVPLLLHSVFLLYGLIVMALWHAPLYAWLLVISGWARRATYLWALLPPLVLAAFERGAFRSSHLGRWMRYRLIGGIGQAFDFDARGNVDSLHQLTPGKFLATPGLWLGLGLAALFLAAAVRLRRGRVPI